MISYLTPVISTDLFIVIKDLFQKQFYVLKYLHFVYFLYLWLTKDKLKPEKSANCVFLVKCCYPLHQANYKMYFKESRFVMAGLKFVNCTKYSSNSNLINWQHNQGLWLYRSHLITRLLEYWYNSLQTNIQTAIS